MIRRSIAVVLLSLSIGPGAWAASSVLVWPIFQTISANEKGSELWLENRGASAVNLQLRIFGWDQKESRDVYADQSDVVASPPFANVQPGQRQLIRLMRVSPVASGEEKSYRIVIDEIPAAQPVKQTDKSSAGLNMRMRYVLPLFTYGQGAEPLKLESSVEPIRTSLNWSLSGQNLCINNAGNQHARLSSVYWSTSAGKPQNEQTQGLLGYILAKRRVCFPTPARAANASGMRLYAKLTDNSQAVEIPAAR
ncbi:fimbrial biogenesis chaperone [Klebsiella aerogenes]|uniref:fimbrial biogenesis chaperone n=1 Tax=Klebsiella TaxID=570 RepID=UPI001BCB453E|nr:molecular chaperone [Klebsiella aerogenes]EKZ9670241.1 molecular chaperone [Klebsiella aerogenes]ELT7619591.1 molecular chaperone [Klebsiella aerogenes]ELY3086782.1 molecular chaperone [Klebsiella aerogenes]MDA3989850.1 molecular chaperone [Klebsiella aerogenes]MDQ8581848.1 molecular chaperone [Klebsiella aerogenes]